MTKGSFTGLLSLEELYLAENEITTIEKGTFDGLHRLEILILKKNKLTTVQKGYFDGIEGSLRYLEMDENKISSIDDDGFNNLTKLDTLIMDENMIKNISKKHFQTLYNLENIHLSDNLIETIDEDAFISLSKVNYFSVWNNSLKSLPASMFNTFAASLDFLSVGSNKDLMLGKDFLKDFQRLETLEFSYTKTKYLPKLNHLKYLKNIFMIKTPISMIYECEFDGLKLENIELFWDRSPINCTCDLDWIKNLFTEDKIHKSNLGLESPVCKYPKNLKNAQLIYSNLCSKDRSKKWCENSKPKHTVVKDVKPPVVITRVIEMTTSLTVIWEINKDVPIHSFFITAKGTNGNTYHVTKRIPLNGREFKFSKLKAHKYYVVCIIALNSHDSEISRSCIDTETSSKVIKRLTKEQIGATVAGLFGFIIAVACLVALIYLNRHKIRELLLKRNKGDNKGIDNIVYDSQRDSVQIGDGDNQTTPNDVNYQSQTNQGNMWKYGHLDETQ